LTIKIVNFFCDRIVCNRWMERRLPKLFKVCGLDDIRVAAGTVPMTDLTDVWVEAIVRLSGVFLSEHVPLLRRKRDDSV
jgi:hypothetical protein